MCNTLNKLSKTVINLQIDLLKSKPYKIYLIEHVVLMQNQKPKPRPEF